MMPGEFAWIRKRLNKKIEGYIKLGNFVIYKLQAYQLS